MNDTVERIPLVYIVSEAYSGSTLLDLLLGMSPHIWTLGEAQRLWLSVADGKPCACGAHIPQCPFWQPILPAIPAARAETLFQLFTPEMTVRWPHLLSILRGRVSAKMHDTYLAYADTNATYLRQVWQAARAKKPNLRWLVDASKDPYRLYALHYSGLFDMRVLHVTKDPRALVYSMVKRHESDSLVMCIRKSARWTIRNAQFNRLSQLFSPEFYRHIRYETLATAPTETINGLLAWLGVDPMTDLSRMRSYESHAVAGNAMRWEERPITLDDRWKSNLSLTNQRIAWFFALTLKNRYGYTW
jgi:hypothetical protein